ncbi:ABC transporter transmembrane domain-containing protein [Ferrimonas lipolytica]|uniref:ATP-binding cassette domain-containing protein n=1 Tax=Ferrimonas lipolytica TaxID=2724191 RepID=A0A6H1UG49_9GAMM|nr:ABC transporter transmembrane domain-containing protein [Ferrimonas lipolytica]QIZ76772.1 ATP-binding cassette domain-containing protein [Ferrimonas lipolytica]
MQTDKRGVVSWVWQFVKPYQRQVVAAAIALLVGSATWLALGQGVRLLVDDGFLSGNADALNQTMLLVLLINLIGALAVFVRFYLVSWLGERVSGDIRKHVFDHLLSLSPSFFETTRTGEVISRFTADTTVLQTVVGMSLSMALRSSVTLIGAMVMMLFTSMKLTLMVMLAVPLVLVPIFFFGRKVRILARSSQDRVATLGAHIDETLHEIQTVQAYGHQQRDKEQFDSQVERVMTTASQRIQYRSGLIAAVMVLSISAITIVSWLGALEVMEGNLSAGELTAFMFYAVMAAGSVATISEVISEVQRAAGATDRLRELTEVVPAIVAPAAAQGFVDEVAGELQFDRVRFAYPSDPNKPVLVDFNLNIGAGERVALVGASGAGKSTLFQLLKLFYRPSSGDIQLDGVSVGSADPIQWRMQFALVPQAPVIFATSVLENVRYGRPEATEAEVIAACQAACAEEFIVTMKDGYNSLLGERGVNLSGGQKQRIAIARAILADRPVLLLDEATSALDAHNEALVKQALERLMIGRTTIIIAHRLATVVNANRIVVMEQGVARAVGDHHSLLRDDTVYRKLAELQLLTDTDNGSPAGVKDD